MPHEPDRTTPAFASPRRAAALALAFGCAMLLPAGAGAIAPIDPAPYAISLERGATRSTPELTISGRWPTPCTPTFQSASLDGAELRVDARAMLSLCARAPTAYTIEVDPAAALGRSGLPGGVYHVSYYTATGGQAEPQLQAFALLDTNARPPAFAPETGFWWTTGDGSQAAVARNVFSFEAQGAQLSAALMTYDRDGRGNWQFGTAPLGGRVAHVPLLRLDGGSDPLSGASASPHGEPGLVLDIEFRTSSLATVWLSRSGTGDAAPLQLQKFDIVRLPFASADGGAWKGDWILVADADDVAPLRLHFNRLVALDTERFRLVDDAGGVVLDCTLAAQNLELPPGNCALHGGNASEIARFSAVAITRMDGSRGDGAPMHLLRISR